MASTFDKIIQIRMDILKSLVETRIKLDSMVFEDIIGYQVKGRNVKQAAAPVDTHEFTAEQLTPKLATPEPVIDARYDAPESTSKAVSLDDITFDDPIVDDDHELSVEDVMPKLAEPYINARYDTPEPTSDAVSMDEINFDESILDDDHELSVEDVMPKLAESATQAPKYENPKNINNVLPTVDAPPARPESRGNRSRSSSETEGKPVIARELDSGAIVFTINHPQAKPKPEVKVEVTPPAVDRTKKPDISRFERINDDAPAPKAPAAEAPKVEEPAPAAKMELTPEQIKSRVAAHQKFVNEQAATATVDLISTISVAPPSEAKAQTSGRVGLMNQPQKMNDMLTAINQHFKTNDWEKVPADGYNVEFKNDKGHDSFEVRNDKMVTQDHSDANMEAMLVGFKAMYKDTQKPAINCPPELEQKWKDVAAKLNMQIELKGPAPKTEQAAVKAPVAPTPEMAMERRGPGGP